MPACCCGSLRSKRGNIPTSARSTSPVSRGRGGRDRRHWRKPARHCPRHRPLEARPGASANTVPPAAFRIQLFRFSCFQCPEYHEKRRGGTKARDATSVSTPAMKTWKLEKLDHSGGSDQNQILPCLAVTMPSSFRARSNVDALIARASPCDFNSAAALGPLASASSR